ncbi:hypothetical protein TVAG_290620 [Trichomonas vaginalis G3]|uniref:Glycosyltransferase 61 catalytic domain-containing protein n=1 Tax=Trichomonas vaginalis (strain ATCC PRA-98 / G3) TaxID=412133 RepID=A2EQU6_TRIV3|nr:glycosyltransferase family [Trichomonas vaginalis G3]EAY04992.1 hypothetical protein TVAG_290620 [Trichomonas vaginalis G3]KAI5553518.1 glycosyltransferase family [Trichomonas vaginalis G3]|eukprot:XP_001317215.1 hypothetical protein [Trichomonas vaginalis G3]
MTIETDEDNGVPYDEKSLAYQHTVFQHYIYCDVSRQGILAYGGNFILPAKHYYDIDPYSFDYGHTLLRYDKAVIGFSFHPQFGHVVQDMIGGILSIPSEILKDAHIFLRSAESQAQQYMKILGISSDRVHILKEEWIFVKDLYISCGYFGISCLQVSFKDLHDIIYRNNNLTNIKPTEYIFINKESNNWGHVKNMQELFDAAQNKYPEIKWTQYPPDTVYNIERAMHLFARTKVFVSATGSTSFNIIFMHPNTSCLLIDGLFCNFPCLAIAHTLDLFFYYYGSDDISRFKKQLGNITVKPFMKALEMVVYAAHNGKWPKHTLPSKSLSHERENLIKKIFKENETNLLEYEQEMERNALTDTYPRIQDYVKTPIRFSFDKKLSNIQKKMRGLKNYFSILI